MDQSHKGLTEKLRQMRLIWEKKEKIILQLNDPNQPLTPKKERERDKKERRERDNGSNPLISSSH